MHCSLRWFNKHHCLSRKVQEWWCHLIITWHCIATTLNHLGLAKPSILQQRQERQIIKIWNAISCLVDMEFVFNFQSRANINLFSYAGNNSTNVEGDQATLYATLLKKVNQTSHKLYLFRWRDKENNTFYAFIFHC